ARPTWAPEERLPADPRAFTPILYGLDEFGKLFTNRQLVALTCFSDLVQEVRPVIERDYASAGCLQDRRSLAEGGTGQSGYADAISTYLAFAVDRLVDRSSTICTWDTGAEGK